MLQMFCFGQRNMVEKSCQHIAPRNNIYKFKYGLNKSGLEAHLCEQEPVT